MRLLVESLSDTASVNLAERLRELVDWEEQGLFQGRRVLAHGPWRMVTIEDVHITHENLHQQLPPSLTDPAVVVFLSRHKAASGQPSLSVHPIGNFADAPYGGREGTVVESHPGWMAGLYLGLLQREPDGFEVTYEATHHGPYLEHPTLFYELGSDEAAWEDEGAARLMAEVLLTAEPADDVPAAFWVGGGHYCPQVNDAVQAGELAPGHIIPGWACDAEVSDEALVQAVEATPDCQGYVLQRGATSSEQKVAERLDALGVPAFEP